MKKVKNSLTAVITVLGAAVLMLVMSGCKWANTCPNHSPPPKAYCAECYH